MSERVARIVALFARKQLLERALDGVATDLRTEKARLTPDEERELHALVATPVVAAAKGEA